jgi:cell division protein FtsA
VSYPTELITAGVIISGGSAKLHSIDSFTADLFNLPVKIGYPDLSRLTGAISRLEDPSYATSIGLIYYGMDQIKDTKPSFMPKFKLGKENVIKKFGDYLKEYL